MDALAHELDIETVLKREANEIHGVELPADLSGRPLYRALNALNSAALTLSGGGIRSAAFALGVIQALATHPRAAAAGAPVESAEKSLLAKFHYLSTVSGGGYIGSWLSALRLRHGFSEIWPCLIGRPDGPDKEPAAIGWLRSYSNYLTPRLGALSADTWATVALSVRNLILNWLVILPAVCSLILVVKIVGIGSDWLTRPSQWALPLDIVFVSLGTACLVKALAFTAHNRPSRDPGHPPSQRHVIWHGTVYSIAASVFIVQFMASDNFDNYFLKGGECCVAQFPSSDFLGITAADHTLIYFIASGAFCGVVIYAVSWLIGWPRRKDVLDFITWSAAGAVFGTLTALGLYFWVQIPEQGIFIFSSVVFDLVFGIPWILLSLTIAEMIFVGLASYQPRSDEDREWLGRASGLLLAAAIGWMLLSFFVFFGAVIGTNVLSPGTQATIQAYSGPIAGLSGLVTAFLGKSTLSSVTGNAGGVRSKFTRAILSFAALVFFAALFVGLSFALDHLLLGEDLVPKLFDDWADTADMMPDRSAALEWFIAGLIVFTVIAAGASKCININRFSLHSLYRNRLIRAFLGSRGDRHADPFIDFDTNDNPAMRQLWPPAAPGNWRPFHIINIALNIVTTRRLAWQERKAEPFMVSALHCGASCLGYRPSETYGDGITLGTAMAISGAAASPNMGYNSSPIVTFMMTMFNVRLGWWLGNPGPKGEKSYTHDGPKFAIKPLVYEAFGLTTDDRKYVYLSDGGHFENLGLYEMVRRRCRLIVVSDAGCDPEYRFEDLGNAVRKIEIDLGVQIRFETLQALKPRGATVPDGTVQSYHAIGEVDYRAADGGGENGVILYVKPGYHGDESAGVRSYAMANPEFPHQATIDQWFSESQFESYRALGFEIMDGVLSRTLGKKPGAEDPRLRNAFFPANGAG